jgi:hypothetical protein
MAAQLSHLLLSFEERTPCTTLTLRNLHSEASFANRELSIATTDQLSPPLPTSDNSLVGPRIIAGVPFVSARMCCLSLPQFSVCSAFVFTATHSELRLAS